MKVAILGESSADETALRVVVDAILGVPSESPAMPPLRSRGWTSVVRVLPGILKHLYYQTDADGCVVVIDTDDSLLHEPDHDAKPEPENCRLCHLRGVVEQTLARLRPTSGRATLKVAIGVASPCIEAWLCARNDVHVGESAWRRALQSNQYPFTRLTLKRWLYGTDRAPLIEETRLMSEAARAVASEFEFLRQRFPMGYGALVDSLRGW